MTKPVQHSCPSCEYERGNPGKPVQKGERVECLICGASWKEFGNLPVSQVNHAALLQEFRGSDVRNNRIKDTPLPKTAASMNEMNVHKRPSSSVFGAMLGVVFVLSLAVMGILLGLDHFSEANQVGRLEVHSVSFEEVVRPNGGKVVRVRGQVSNGLEQTVSMPKVEILLKQSNGKALARWFYSAQLTNLEPGANMRFVSAYPVDAPAIASAEARLLR